MVELNVTYNEISRMLGRIQTRYRNEWSCAGY